MDPSDYQRTMRSTPAVDGLAVDGLASVNEHRVVPPRGELTHGGPPGETAMRERAVVVVDPAGELLSAIG